MKKLLFSSLLLLATFMLPAAVKLADYKPGKSPDARNLKFKAHDDILVMDFASGNGAKSRGWMRQYADFMPAGSQLKISIDVKSSQVSDADAQVFLLVQPVDDKNRGVRGKIFARYVPAGDYADKWKTLEYTFVMPDPAYTLNWNKGRKLMINFGAASQNGVFEFKNLKTVLSGNKPAPEADIPAENKIPEAAALKLAAASLKNPDFVYNVKFPAKKSYSGVWSFELPNIDDIHGYVPVLSFDFAMKNNIAAVQPVLTINNKKLNRLDNRHLPRLLNSKNASDGGSKNYMYSLKKLFAEKQNTKVVVQAGNRSDFTLKNIKLFYKAETLPLYPDAPAVRKDAFTILPGKTLKVAIDGKVFLEEAEITGVKNIDALPDKACVIGKKSDKITTHNLVQINDPTVDFRREARIMPDGELEIFMRSVYKKPDHINYSYRLTLPAELFDGAKYEVRHGHRNKYNSIAGTVKLAKGSMKNILIHPKTGKPITHIHYLYLEKNGIKLVFDFSPLSVSGQINPYCQEPQKILNFIYKQGNKIIFDFGKRSNPEYYGFFVRIHFGDIDHYYRHGNTITYYPSGPYHDNHGYQISFADKKATARLNKSLYDFPFWQDIYQMPFQSAAKVEKGKELILPGWTIVPQGFTTYQTGGKFPGSAGVFVPQGRSVYTLPIEPGIYMGSLTVGHTDKDVEKLSIKCNGEVVAENVSVKANNFRQIFFSVYVKSPARHAVLEFDGKNYAVNQLVLRNTMTETEDYVWKNKFWQVKGLPEFALDVDYINKPGYTEPEPPNVMGKFVTEAIPQDGVYPNAGKNVYPQKPFPPLEKTTREHWAWNIVATSIGGGNNESGMVFRPNEEFRQLCKAIKRAGYNVIKEQGLFWNLCYDEKTRKVHMKNLGALAKIMHEEGLKLSRHADGPSFNTIFRGAYATAEAAGWFPVDLGTLKSFQGAACITNPYLRNHVISILEEYVRETDCDMLMIDELYVLRTGGRCACVYCRKKFAEDTGFSLPMPDDQAQLFTPGNQLNAIWMEWKMRQDGSFFQEMKERLTKIKKDILITSYGVDFQHPIGRFQLLAPYVDVLGIEGTNHCLLQNYRHLLACRKLQAGYADEHGQSQWHIHNRDSGLSDLPTIRYIYRAFCSLNRSGVVTYVGHPVLKNTRLDWPHWPDFRYMKPIADVAVFHRWDGCYQPTLPDLTTEQFGISQLLSDKHIPHEFVMSLTPERLAKFKLLIMGNATILSNEEINVIKEFVKNGGKLLITGTFGALDKLFKAQDASRYTDLTGVEFPDAQLPATALHKLKNTRIATHRSRIKVLDGKILARFDDNTPGIICKKYGKGMVITTPLTPGMKAFEKIILRGQPYTRATTAEGAAILDELLKYTNHTRYPVMLSGAGSKVMIESCRDTRNGDLIIQLLNFDVPMDPTPGKVLKPLTAKEVTFRNPANDLIITLPEKITSASAVSPDIEGTHPLPVKVLDNGSSQIVIKPQLLKVYTVINVKK